MATGPLGESATDSAVQWIADRGAYVAEVTSADNAASGEVLIEAYSFP